MKRPQEKDYFEYRGKTLIMDHGRAENFMDAQNDYIDYLEAQIKSKKSAIPIVSDCTIRDWIITYADSDGTIQKAVVSGKDGDEAIANFQSDYHQEWRTIKAVV